ncbi:MAG: preprotein translocase subunit YajC [Ahrensia sp.]|nr:preprotein translocase subunit YajC [Ahrensia sp.]
MFITPAYAQSAGGAGGGILELLFPLILVGVIMWFLVIRPQRQQAKAREEMLGAVKRNDTIVTGGGVVGKVTKVVDDSEVEVQIAPDVKVRVLRSMIADVRVKGDVAKAEPAAKGGGEAKPTRGRKKKAKATDETTE